MRWLTIFSAPFRLAIWTLGQMLRACLIVALFLIAVSFLPGHWLTGVPFYVYPLALNAVFMGYVFFRLRRWRRETRNEREFRRARKMARANLEQSRYRHS